MAGHLWRPAPSPFAAITRTEQGLGVTKHKAKISSTQRDKNLIAAAKRLKKAGILSNQANLHSGHYISKAVARKVKAHLEHDFLHYRAVKVDRKTAAAAKERGFEVVNGNKIIGPATANFRNRLKKGLLTGVKPVKGGMMEEVVLPHTIFDLKTLEEGLASGIDSLKMPEEQFAFAYKGWESYKPFMNSQMMLEYLRHYKGIFEPGQDLTHEEMMEEFQNLVIFRLHPSTTRANLRNVEMRKKDRAADRRAGLLPPLKTRRVSLAERLERMSPERAARIRKKIAERVRKRRERIAADPVKAKAEKIAARARAKKSYERRKGK